jgi:hypothetical protein
MHSTLRLRRSISLPTGAASIIALFLATASPSHSLTIAWVTDTVANDTAAINYLTSLGHTIIGATNQRYRALGTGAGLDAGGALLTELSNVDLVIVSRSTDSGQYAGSANSKTAAWNSLPTPIILGSAYLSRGGSDTGGRWGWMATSGLSEGVSTGVQFSPPADDLLLFRGLTSPFSIASSNADFPGLNVGLAFAGEGTILATRTAGIGTPRAAIAFWEAGDLIAPYGTSTALGGDRLLLVLPLISSNITPEGLLLLSNAIYFMVPEPTRAILFALGATLLIARRRR